MAAGIREWPSCVVHATAEEVAEHRAAIAREEEDAERLFRRLHQALPVACWSWPVTGEHRRRAADSRACLQPERAYELAWKLLVDWHDGRCAVCGARDRRYLDHSHGTGLVRGWLCQSCNISEGFGSIPGGQFERYRERYPTAILEISLPYRSPFPSWC